MSSTRDKVRVQGLPYLWTTNLTDNEVRSVYSAIARDLEAEPGYVSTAGNAIKAGLFYRCVPFKGGLCLCVGIENHVTAIYRTHSEWQEWEAKNEEAERLRLARQAEESVRLLTYQSQNEELHRQIRTSIGESNLDEALRLFRKLLDLQHDTGAQLTSDESYRTQCLAFELFPRLVDWRHSLEYLLDVKAPSHQVVRFVESFIETHDRLSEDTRVKADAFLRSAMYQHDDVAGLYKRACLLWRRVGDYKRALTYCQEAISKSLPDRTRGGWQGRLVRLEREAVRKGMHRLTSA